MRLWPGVVAAALIVLLWYVVPAVFPGATLVAFGGFAGALAVLVWWLFFSRAPWSERVGAIVLMAVALFATRRLVHPSIAHGAMGMLLFVYAIPALAVALVVGAAAGRRLATWPRRASMAAAILLACGAFTLIRTGGFTGEGDSDFHWRWTPSPEERLLARGGDEPAALSPAPKAAETPTPPAQASEPPSTAATPAPPATARALWPGFRGPRRDGVVRGVRIETDWSRKPPDEVWRRSVGPGWSSFAVSGDVFYTQEQRGEHETVGCYRVATGEPVWRHRDAARFWESNAGAGPRGTPTLSRGRVYTHGATGIVNALDADDGAVIWSRNAAADTGAKRPTWGFASSPLVMDDRVIVASAGHLVAYDLATGTPRWFGPKTGGGYSSPHLLTIDGVPQVLLLNGAGAIGVAPADGTVLWEHRWPGDGIVQPALTADGDLLIGSGSGMGEVGVRRVAIGRGSGGWTVQERWTSNGLKPYYNDLVVHEGHAFGFDGGILACIDLADGTRKWKGGRYGHGQLVLLPEQDVLLVLSEEGELALVGATPDQFRELARAPAIKGKTWNHPVLVRDVLLVRNGEEMAAFRLALAGR